MSVAINCYIIFHWAGSRQTRQNSFFSYLSFLYLKEDSVKTFQLTSAILKAFYYNYSPFYAIYLESGKLLRGTYGCNTLGGGSACTVV